jgi:hypothetical protein
VTPNKRFPSLYSFILFFIFEIENMFKLFGKNKKDANKNPVNKGAAYGNDTDSELFQALKRKFIHVDSTFQRTRLLINLKCN